MWMCGLEWKSEEPTNAVSISFFKQPIPSFSFHHFSLLLHDIRALGGRGIPQLAGMCPLAVQEPSGNVRLMSHEERAQATVRHP